MSDLASLYIKVDSSGVVTASKDLAGLEGKAKTVEQELSALGKKSTDAGREVVTATQAMNTGFTKLQATITALAGSWALLQTAQMVQAVVAAQVSWERLNVAMEAATGSASRAMENMAFVRAESQRLGISLESQSKAFTKLVAASKGTSLEGEATRKIFTAVAQASTALQLSTEDTSGTLYAITQMMSKGTVQAEELRGQLGERLPGAFQIAAKAMGTTTQGLGKMLEQGQVFSEDFLPKFAKALIEQYAGSIEKASQSTAAQIERLKTAFFDAKVAIGESFGSSTQDTIKAATEIIKKMMEEMRKPETVAMLTQISGELTKLVVQFGNDFPSGLNKTLQAINGLLTLYNSLPDGVVGATGTGIIGRMLLGSGGFTMMAGLYLMNNELEKIGLNIGSLPGKMAAAMAAIKNLQDVATGKKDWNTGKPLTGPFQGGEPGKVSGAGATWEEAAPPPASSIVDQKKLDAEKKAAKEAAAYLKKLQSEDRKGTTEGIQAQMDEWDTYYIAIGKLSTESAAETEKLRKEDLKGMLAGVQAQMDAGDAYYTALGKKDEVSVAQKAADEAGRQVTFYKDMIGMENEYRQAKLDWIKLEAEAQIAGGKKRVEIEQWAKEKTIQFEYEIYAAKAQKIGQGLASMESAFSSISSMYAEGTSEHNRWAEAANAMMIAQKAVAVVNAVAAVAASAAAPWPAGFVSMAAMAASMVSLLGSIGAGIGGSSATAPSGPAYGQNTTVLGGENGEGSQSISKSWELMQDTYDMEDTKLSGIYNEMKDLNQNITGIVQAVIYGKPQGYSGFDTGEMANYATSMLGENSPPGKFFENMRIISEKGSLGFGKLLTAVDKYMWGSSRSYTGAAGIQIDDIGKSVNQYVKTVTEESGGGFLGTIVGSILGSPGLSIGLGRLGVGDSNTASVETTVDKKLTDLFFGPQGVYTNLRNVAKGATEILGGDTANVTGYDFGTVTLDFLNKTPEEIQKILSAKISEIGDIMAEKLFDAAIFENYQKVGEGPLETIIRIVMEKEKVLADVLDMTGKAFSGTAMEAVALSQSLIEIAGGLDKLTEAANTYYDKFFSDAEKQVKLQGDLTAIMKDLGYSALPATREGFRAIVEGLDLTTTWGQEAYVTLLKASGMADEFFTGLEESLAALLGTATDALGGYTTAVQDAASNAHKLADEYRAIGVSLRDAIREIGGETNLSKNKFNETYAKAMTGDTESLTALPALAKAYLADSMASSRTAVEYARDKAMTLNALQEAEKVSILAMNWAEYQAGVLDGMLGILDKIKVELEKGVTANLTLIEGWMEALGSKENMLDWSHFVESPAWGTLITTEPVWSDLIPEPIWTDIMPEPIWGQLVPEPAWSLLVPEPVWTSLIPEPDWAELTTEPDWTTLIPEPVWTNLVPEPIWGSLVPEPSWSSLIPEPIWSSLVPEPVWGGVGGIIPDVTWATYIDRIDWTPVTGGMSGFVSHLTAITAANSPLITVTTKFGELQSAIGNFMTAIGAREQAIVNWVPPAPVVPVTTVTPATPSPSLLTAAPDPNEWVRSISEDGSPRLLGSPDLTGWQWMAQQEFNAMGPSTWSGSYQKMPGYYALGGIASGPESGYGATLHGTELIVSPRTSYPATVKGGDGSNVVMIEELRALRASVEKTGAKAEKNASDISYILNSCVRGGLTFKTEAV